MVMIGGLILLALTVLPLQDIGFSGTWERNQEQSDDPQEKMQAAMSQMREQAGARGGRGGGGGRGGQRGAGGGRSGGGGRGGAGPQIGRITDELLVTLEGEEFHVDNGERLSIYYLDGEKHRRETASGAELETKAELKGSAVLIEEKTDRGTVARKFELSPDGATMIMTVSVKFGRMNDPVVIRTVYEKAGAAD